MNRYHLKLTIFSYSYFLSVIKSNNIEIFSLKQVDNDVYFSCSYKEYIKLKKIYPSIIVLNKTGIYKLINNLIINYSLIIGIIISMFFYGFLNTRIMDIEIQGNNINANKIIDEELVMRGISNYKKIPSTSKLKTFSKEILDNNNQLFSLFSIYKKGNHIFVQYQLRPEELNYINIKGNIYSKYDAIIDEIKIERGNILVKRNQFVRKDQLLVDENYYYKDNPIYIGTQGIIYGIVYQKVDYSYQNLDVDSFIDIVNTIRNEIAKDFSLDEKIIKETIIFHDEENKKLVIHYTLKRILNKY